MTPIEEVKSRLDIVEVVKDYIPLKQSGSNWKANCPFHQEKSPSFMVSKEKQIWHCFGCNEGGDVITFVQKFETLTFPEALRLLAERAGVVLPAVSEQGPSAGEKNILWTINEKAAGFWQSNLRGSTEAAKKTLNYLIQRGLKPESIDLWSLGLALDGWDGLYQQLRSAGFSDGDLLRAGLVSQKDGRFFDRFRTRLMFPIRDVQGKIVAFTGRTLINIAFSGEDFGGKYVNSPQTVVYNKSAVLYGLDLAKQEIKQKNYAIVVEGNMDAIMSYQAGVKNVVAVSGTALTADQLRLLQRFTHNVILAFDSDAAGSQALYKSGVMSASQFDMNVKALVLLGVKDPAEIIQDNPSQWVEEIKKSQPIIDFYFEEILKRVDLNRADHKKIASRKLITIITQLKNNVEQDHYIKKLSEKLHISEQILWQMIEQERNQAKMSEVSAAVAPTASGESADVLAEALLAVISIWPDCLPMVIDKIEPEVFQGAIQELYKMMIIYYTKNQSTDLKALTSQLSEAETQLWSRIVHHADSQYAELTAVQLESELQSIIKLLKTRWLKVRMRAVSESIAEAEAVGDAKELQQHILEYTELSQKLAGYLS